MNSRELVTELAKKYGGGRNELRKRFMKAAMGLDEVPLTAVAQKYGLPVQKIHDMMSGRRQWPEGLLASISRDLGLEEFFKDTGLI